jgi:hypothetical protein
MAHMNTATADGSINRASASTRLIAGISVSDTPLIAAVIEYAQRISEPYLFNHAMRSWLFAEAMAARRVSATTARSWRSARSCTTLASPPVSRGPIASR